MKCTCEFCHKSVRDFKNLKEIEITSDNGYKTTVFICNKCAKEA